jgi:predicted hydrolase (HD superfamily)
MEVDENGNSPYHDYKVLTASADTIKRKFIENELLLGIDRRKTRHFRKDGMTLAQIMGIVKDAAIWLSGHSN